ncbi:MAG: hypothetical protein HY706_19125 [Candidatus Hydrogenedentes bacterium]|nr:hypothetical protein [Candidatus Hydrogenedentota bacterium]
MTKRDQLPHLLKLLDDDSPRIREHITQELLAFGPGLWDEVRSLEPALTDRQKSLVYHLLSRQRHSVVFAHAWRRWPLLPDELDRLESAYELLARFQYGWTPPVRLSELLDDLAQEFLASRRFADPVALSHYLFSVKKFRGNIEDYYNPLNSNLMFVAQERKGIPVTLASVFMLVGKRVGVAITGCNLPANFLARAQIENGELLFDCFNGGQILTAQDVKKLRATLARRQTDGIAKAPSAVQIIARVLRNMINAYDLVEDAEKSRAAQGLLQSLPEK